MAWWGVPTRRRNEMRPRSTAALPSLAPPAFPLASVSSSVLFVQSQLNDTRRSAQTPRVAPPLRSDGHEVSESEPPSPIKEVTLSKTRVEFIEVVGRLCQQLGLPRSIGQIYGLLYLSPISLSLDDIAVQLSISKASASTGTRQLASWQAIRQVWVPGDRRDYFEAVGDLRELLESIYRNYFKPKFEKGGRKLDALLASLESDRESGGLSPEEYVFCKERLDKLGKVEDRIARLLPVAEKLL